MSGIFGILTLDGQPVVREHLQAIRTGMAYWGPHGSSVWQNERVGLGHLLLNNAPEARHEFAPCQHSASGIVVTAQARIDNRDELIAKLESPSGISHQPSPLKDNELILHSYLRWGEECVHHLIGDWAFAVWDPRERKLFVARDHWGISALYYYHHPRFFAFASSIKGLLALPVMPKRPNLFRVAQVLTSWPGDGEQTAYEEIFRLPPAHALTVTAEKLEKRRYWFVENTPPVRLGSDEDYLEAFLEIYTKAVRCRLSLSAKRGVGATLSSGLDSGSVCALAARELRSRGECLPVFTSVPIFNTEGLTKRNRYGDESPLVELNRQFIGNLDVKYIRAESVSPMTGIERALQLHDSPGHAAGNLFWIFALLETARQQRLGVLLTGQAGNGTISWSGGIENFWPLMLAGQWGAVFSKSKKTNLPLRKIIRNHFLRPLFFPIHNQMTRYRYLRREPWEEYSAINAAFARSLDLKRKMKERGHDPTFSSSANSYQARLQILRPEANIVGATWAENGAAYGLEVRDPTMDKRLMEFCLAIPDEQYRLNGQDRYLIRRAMQGLLPDAVRLNNRRGLQAADLGYRLLAELPRVQAMMARLEQSSLAREVLDLPKMNGVLLALQKEVNATTTKQCGAILTRGMMAGMFLLRFEKKAD